MGCSISEQHLRHGSRNAVMSGLSPQREEQVLTRLYVHQLTLMDRPMIGGSIGKLCKYSF